MKKFLHVILLLSSLLTYLNASFLFDKNYPICIEDYYIKGGKLYYLRSASDAWSSTKEDNVAGFIYAGYEWDADNGICKPKEWLILGMDVKDWNFLLGLVGLLIGVLIMYYTIELFMKVGGKR